MHSWPSGLFLETIAGKDSPERIPAVIPVFRAQPGIVELVGRAEVAERRRRGIERSAEIAGDVVVRREDGVNRGRFVSPRRIAQHRDEFSEGGSARSSGMGAGPPA